MGAIIGAVVAAAAVGGGTYLSTPDKTKIPNFKGVSATGSQSDAIKSNLLNFDSASQLASKVTRFNQQEILDMLKMAVPDYSAVQGAQKDLLLSEMKGEVPKDVRDLIQRKTATQSMYGGFGRSGMGRNLEARDLGLTSLNITQQGFDHASQWLQQAKSVVATPFNMASSFLDYRDIIASEQWNTANRFNRDMMQAEQDAQPSKWAKALGAALSSFGGMAGGMMSGAPTGGSMPGATKNTGIGGSGMGAWLGFGRPPKDSPYGPG